MLMFGLVNGAVVAVVAVVATLATTAAAGAPAAPGEILVLVPWTTLGLALERVVIKNISLAELIWTAFIP